METRAGSAAIVAMIGRAAGGADVAELQIAVARPPGRRAPLLARGRGGTIVWLHGGGWVIDGIEVGDAMCRILADIRGPTS